MLAFGCGLSGRHHDVRATDAERGLCLSLAVQALCVVCAFATLGRGKGRVLAPSEYASRVVPV